MTFKQENKLTKLNDVEASMEHSDKVNLEKFKRIDRVVSHINGIFRNYATERTVLEEIIWELRTLERKKLTVKPRINAKKK